MKCAICGADNPPEANSCQQCGFNLQIEQPTWPDFPTIEMPQPTDEALQWPEMPVIDVPSIPREPFANEIAEIRPDSLPSHPTSETSEITGRAIDLPPSPPEEMRDEAPPPVDVDVTDVMGTEEAAVTERLTDDDRLAQEHIARGHQALRQGLADQAQWEIEQARDLADDADIVKAAQAQLDRVRQLMAAEATGAASEDEIPPLLPPPEEQPDDDQLARDHLARGFEAARQNLLDQARQEFERARDLAVSSDVSRLAQAQLEGLHAPPTAPESEEVSIVRESAAREEPITRLEEGIVSLPKGLDRVEAWKGAFRIGLIAGLVNAVLTGCSAIFCLGVLITPLSSFIVGWAMGRRSPKSDRSAALYALLAGGLTGVGGWVGQMIGYPTWASSVDSLRLDPDSIECLACASGTVYVPAAMILSAIGWKKGTSKR